MKKKFTNLFSGLLIVGMLTNFSVFAQKTLYLDSVYNVFTVGSSINVSLRTKNLSNVLGLQGSIVWDTAVLKYTNITYGSGAAIVLNSTNVGLTNTAKGNVTFLWFDANLSPQTVADTTKLLTLSFTINKVVTGTSIISLSNTPTGLEIDVPDLVGFPAAATDTAFLPGRVFFLNQPTISRSGSTLTAVVTGTPVAYQWYLNGVAIPGATSNVYTNATVAGGSYSFSVTYPDGTVVTSVVALPIELRKFNGYLFNDNAYLSWSVLNETNIESYYIQFSSDGKEFTTVDTRKAAHAKETNNYELSVEAKTNADKIYYRLLIKGIDGSISYSNTLTLSTANSASDLNLYPSAVSSNTNLQFISTVDGTSTVQITDMLGRVFKTFNITVRKGNNLQSFNLSNLPKGSYFMILKGEKKAQRKFSKN